MEASREQFDITIRPADLTQDPLKPIDAKNTFIKTGLVYSKDKRSRENQLHMDWYRGGVTIQGIDSSEANRTTYKDDQAGFIKLIEQQFGERAKDITTHHSQSPMMFTSSALGSCAEVAKSLYIGEPKASDLAAEIFRENGEVYLKSRVERLPIVHMDNGPQSVGHLQGPVEVLFKLQANGFALQSISTNSPAISGMFLNGVMDSQTIAEIEQKDAKLTQIENSLKQRKVELGRNKAAKSTIIDDALTAIKKFRNGEIDELALVKKMYSLDTTSKLARHDSLLKRAQSFAGFTPDPSDTSRLLTRISKELEFALLPKVTPKPLPNLQTQIRPEKT